MTFSKNFKFEGTNYFEDNSEQAELRHTAADRQLAQQLSQENRLANLQKEVNHLKQERDFLLKVTTYFAQKSIKLSDHK